MGGREAEGRREGAGPRRGPWPGRETSGCQGPAGRLTQHQRQGLLPQPVPGPGELPGAAGLLGPTPRCWVTPGRWRCPGRTALACSETVKILSGPDRRMARGQGGFGDLDAVGVGEGWLQRADGAHGGAVQGSPAGWRVCWAERCAPQRDVPALPSPGACELIWK